MAAQAITFFGFDDARLIDITGPLEVFSTANAIVGEDLYEISVLSVDGSDVKSGAGAKIGVDGAVADRDDEIDILVVPGSFEWDRVSRDEEVLDALRTAVARSRRVVAVCAGSFLLAEIGLLDGRRATTIWDLVGELTERFPAVEVDGRPIFIADGDVYTSAGGTAGIDLALAIVEADHGAELARSTAQYLVVFMQRPGDAAQFSARMLARPTSQPELRALLDGIAEDPAGDHRLSALSERAGFSERHLARLFKRDLGMTPARYVEAVRVEEARSLLVASDAPLEVIAERSGLSSAETLRRAFSREVGVTPHAYRTRFRTTGIAA